MKNLDLSSIVRTNLSQAVAEQLITLIRDGSLKPGERLLSERELMESLNVGRSSVREAVQRLTMLGLVEVRPGLGTFVAEGGHRSLLMASLPGLLSVDELTADLLEAREMIEPQIAALAAQRATEDDLAHMQVILNDTRTAIARREPVFRRSALFHKALAEATHNAVVVRFVESVMDLLVERGQAIDTIPGYSTQELQAHQHIVALVRAGDADQARAFLKQHIEDSTALYIDTIAPR